MLSLVHILGEYAPICHNFAHLLRMS